MNKVSFKMVLILTAVAFIASLLISLVYSITKDRIEDEYRKEFLRGLVSVFPPFDNEPDSEKKNINDTVVYIAKKSNKVIAYAVKSLSKKGYGGSIEVLVGVDILGDITGIEILKHAETPGLGNKIEKVFFKDAFKGLNTLDKIAVKKDGGIIDEFSGATITPRAVCEAVEKGLIFISTNVLEPR